MRSNVKARFALSTEPSIPSPHVVAGRLRLACSRAILILALTLYAATFLLISPPPGATYPGALPWHELSILRPLIDLMSLNGLVASVRGVEIKDFAFHLVAALGILVLGVAQLVPADRPQRSPAARIAGYAQMLLAGWVLVSALSSQWSGQPDFSGGQAALYALSLGWAVAVAQTFDRRHLRPLLLGVVVISAVGAVLCVWYAHERNPFHRPGFPVGNPSVLAATILPGVLVALAMGAGAVVRTIRNRTPAIDWATLGVAVALVPLIWCLALTHSRGAIMALATAIGIMIVLLAGRRVQFLLGVVLTAGLCTAGVWLYQTSHLELAMARGAAMRFRFYAWRYAAELWQTHPIAGNGAGAYPRLAGQLAADDRALDPAAFMGEIIEHAHNELFEVLTEIGLVGGVTFVAGFLATAVAAAILFRRRSLDPQRWLLLALAASVAALLADSMVGIALRLPGGAAVFFTLLGALWAVCRTTPDHTVLPDRTDVTTEPRGWKRNLLLGSTAVVCFAAAAGAGWVAVSNWYGVVREQAANTAYAEGRYPDALREIQAADARLLDPVRKVEARWLALRARLAMVGEAFGEWAQPTTSASAKERWQRTTELAQRAWSEALMLDTAVPSLQYTNAAAAQAAEWMFELLRGVEPSVANSWFEQAELAWRRQRGRTRYDVDTLLALTRYRATLGSHIGLLRDALRFGDTQGVWLASLARLAEAPGFEPTLAQLMAAVGPFTPETELDSLIASMAPESYRLVAAWHALRGEYDVAAAAAGRAAELYEPMRARFPRLRSVAQAEQAGYLFRASVANVPNAIALLRAAITGLPVIQEQKYEDMVRPFRFQLALYLLVAGDQDEALAMARAALGEYANDRDIMTQLLDKLISDAAAAGVSAEAVQQIRTRLCPEYPGLCTPEAESQPTAPVDNAAGNG